MPRPALKQPPAIEVPAPRQKSLAREYAEALAIAFLLAMTLRTFIVQAYKIPSGSMEQTLLIGDHIIVNKLAYGLRMPDSFFGITPLARFIPYGHYVFRLGAVHRGDVAVFVYPEDPTKDFIKRVVGVPGDTIEIKGGQVYVNGVFAPPPPGTHYEVPAEQRGNSPRDLMAPEKLPAGQYFMMGDNRDRSYDSRFWGTVSRDAIEGHALFIYWSCADDASAATCLYDVRWSRLFNIIR